MRWEKTKHMYGKPKDQNLPYNFKCKHLQKELQIIPKKIQLFF